jgi:hypothetical protein
MALLRLGHDRTIADLTEQSAEAGYCRTFWDQCRKSVLRSHLWNFATKTASLASVVETSDEYDYDYALPVKCLRAVEIVNAYSKAPEDRIPFVIRGRKVYTDQDSAVLKYVEDVDDENQFDHEFTDALIYMLAGEVAGPLTQDLGRQSRMLELYRLRIGDAKASDLSEGETQPSVTYMESRA